MPKLGFYARLAITAPAWFLLLFLTNLGFEGFTNEAPGYDTTSELRNALFSQYPYYGYLLAAAAIGLAVLSFYILGKPLKDDAKQKSDTETSSDES